MESANIRIRFLLQAAGHAALPGLAQAYFLHAPTFVILPRRKQLMYQQEVPLDFPGPNRWRV